MCIAWFYTFGITWIHILYQHFYVKNLGISIVGALGGALRLGAHVLDPPPKLTDLKKQSEDVEKAIESSTGVIQEALHTKLKTIQDEINDEWTAHFKTLQME